MKHFLRLLAGLAVAALLGMAPAYAGAVLAIDSGTATGTSNASTCAHMSCIVTTESASTAAGATFTETVTATPILATDVCLASVTTAGTGTPAVTKVTPSAGQLVVIIQNIHATAAFNNTLAISYACFHA